MKMKDCDRRFKGISAYQSKSKKITSNENWLNSDFYKFIWLVEESTKITSNSHPKLKTYLEIKVYLQLTDGGHPRLALWPEPGRENAAKAAFLQHC